MAGTVLEIVANKIEEIGNKSPKLRAIARKLIREVSFEADGGGGILTENS